MKYGGAALGTSYTESGDVDGDDLADVFTGDGLSDIVWGAAAYDPSTVSNGGGAFVLFSVRE